MITGTCPRCRGDVETESYAQPATCCGIVFWIVDPASAFGMENDLARLNEIRYLRVTSNGRTGEIDTVVQSVPALGYHGKDPEVAEALRYVADTRLPADFDEVIEGIGPEIRPAVVGNFDAIQKMVDAGKEFQRVQYTFVTVTQIKALPIRAKDYFLTGSTRTVIGIETVWVEDPDPHNPFAYRRDMVLSSIEGVVRHGRLFEHPDNMQSHIDPIERARQLKTRWITDKNYGSNPYNSGI